LTLAADPTVLFHTHLPVTHSYLPSFLHITLGCRRSSFHSSSPLRPSEKYIVLLWQRIGAGLSVIHYSSPLTSGSRYLKPHLSTPTIIMAEPRERKPSLLEKANVPPYLIKTDMSTLAEPARTSDLEDAHFPRR
jgi:hypothetical protein